MQKRHYYMLFGYIFTSYVIQFICVIIMETCNLIGIFNCVVKIIYQDFNKGLILDWVSTLSSFLEVLKQFMVC